MDDERPIECGQCKKPLAVHYKEIINGSITASKMCADCPILQQKLHGCESGTKSQIPHNQNVCCNACQTSYGDMLAGAPLGCNECYTVFEGAILNFLKENDLIAPHMGASLHVGKTPDLEVETHSFQKVMELNDELNKALAQENYEEAAWLRDQINTMKEGSDDSSDH